MPSTPKGSAKSASNYRYLGDHATELEIGDTRPWVGPGDFVDVSGMDMNDPKIKEMVDNGILVDVSTIVPTQEDLDAHAVATENSVSTESTVSTGSTEGGS